MEKIGMPAYARQVLDQLAQAGYKAFAVGGCVRDSLLRQEPADWDVTTSALPAETIAAFAKTCKVIETGLRHGTVTVLMDGHPVEITTYRVDGAYSDGRHPDTVSFTRNLREDLARRDFTINAMAYSPSSGIADPFGGRQDLAAGLVRCVGEPDRRFREDALRILRALRFSAVLGFAIEPKTAKSLRENRDLLWKIARERIFAELCRLVCGQNAREVLWEYPEVVRAAAGIPLAPSEALAKLPADPRLRLAAVLEELSPKEADAVLSGFRSDRETRRLVRMLLTHRTADLRPERPLLRRWLARIGPADLQKLITFRRAYGEALLNVRRMLDEILADGDCFCLAGLAVDGSDLAAHGYSGREIGKSLDMLLDWVIDGKLPNEKEALLKSL
ncbi:CCA tRNA nucleotidyltransferase [Anaerotruncus rubiinfantis]|uniref:CCA tRNA nucleotidyltransferase n=1 Tax=Anaerotruncus rubiinfantis TaxID=1720200 RepID=UPI0034A59036